MALYYSKSEKSYWPNCGRTEFPPVLIVRLVKNNNTLFARIFAQFPEIFFEAAFPCVLGFLGVFSTEKGAGPFVPVPSPAARATHPEHPRSPASPGLLSQMPMRKAPPARTGLEGLIALHHFPFTAAISTSVQRFTES